MHPPATGHEKREAKRPKIKLKDVIEELEARGHNPIESILRVLDDPASDLDDRTRLQTEIAMLPYIYARKSTTVVQGDDDKPIRHSIKIQFDE